MSSDQTIIEADPQSRAPSTACVLPFSDTLTPMAQRFCEEFVLNGGRGEAAAIAAGYGGGARNMATRNLCKPKIQAEIARLSKVTLGAALPVAIARLMAILSEEGEDVDRRAQVQAAQIILDRAGLHVPRGPAVAVQINMDGKAAQSVLADVAAARARRLADQPSPALPAPQALD